MSAIAGIIHFGNPMAGYSDTVCEMIDKQKHRGIDSLGTYFAKGVALGASQKLYPEIFEGVQPVTRCIADKKYTIVCDAHITNAKALREQLMQSNCTFCTRTDAELILVAYMQWGASLVDKITGSFAIAIFDESSQKLFLARDEMGIKPLYYTCQNSKFTFSSEIKGILANKDIKRQMGEEQLRDLFALAPAHKPGYTLFKNIFEVKPGECIVYSRLGIYAHTFWNFHSHEHTDDVETTIQTVRQMVEKSLIASVSGTHSLGCFLSGGLDSSILCALAARELSDERLRTFSIDYEENEKYFNSNYFQVSRDNKFVDIMSEHLGSEHFEIMVSLNTLTNCLFDAMFARDMPGMADVDSSLLIACRQVKEMADVVVSGECADEIFCGYPWLNRDDLLYQDIFPWSGSMELRNSIINPRFEDLDIENYTRDCYAQACDQTPLLMGEDELETRRRKMAYVNLKWFGANLIDRKDRMSMYSGLQARMPFANKEIAGYAFNIPYEFKQTGGMEKGILRAAFKDILPAAIYARKKTPYPKTHNPKYTALVQQKLQTILADKASPILNIIDESAVRRLIDEGISSELPWYGQLMTGPQLYAFLIQVDMWLKEYKIDILC